MSLPLAALRGFALDAKNTVASSFTNFRNTTLDQSSCANICSAWERGPPALSQLLSGARRFEGAPKGAESLATGSLEQTHETHVAKAKEEEQQKWDGAPHVEPG